MKKLLIISLISLLILSGCSIKEDYVTKICNDNINDSQTGVEKLLDNDNYKKESDDLKYNDVKELLECYQSKGKITDVYGDKDNYMFSYTDENGYASGVMIKDFDPNMN